MVAHVSGTADEMANFTLAAGLAALFGVAALAQELAGTIGPDGARRVHNAMAHKIRQMGLKGPLQDALLVQLELAG